MLAEPFSGDKSFELLVESFYVQTQRSRNKRSGLSGKASSA